MCSRDVATERRGVFTVKTGEEDLRHLAGIDNNYLKKRKSPGTFKENYKGFCQTQRERNSTVGDVAGDLRTSCLGESGAALVGSPAAAFPSHPLTALVRPLRTHRQHDLLGQLFRDRLDCGANTERREAASWAGRIESRPWDQPKWLALQTGRGEGRFPSCTGSPHEPELLPQMCDLHSYTGTKLRRALGLV